MDWYFQHTVTREQIAEAQRQAARQHLLGRGNPSRARSRCWVVVQQLVQAASISRMKRRLQTMVGQ